MSDTYTKLFSSITESTVWGEPYPTRIVWVTMLAMADARGNVYGAVPGLARRANVTLQEVEAALAAFLAPDPYSRTQTDDGRRIEVIKGGWNLINHGMYANVRNADERKEYQRQWDREHRGDRPNNSRRTPDNPRQPPTDSDAPDPTSTNTNTKKQQKQKTAPEGDLLEGVSPQVASDFRALRSKLRAPITATAMKGIRREAALAGLVLEAALVMCCERGWRGFKADWIAGNARAGPASAPSKQTIGLAGFLGVDPHDLHNERSAGAVVHEADRTVPRGPLLAGPGGRTGGGEH